MRNLKKAIYGLAATWYDPVPQYEEKEGTVFHVINSEGIRFDGKVGATLNHDFTKVLGTSDQNHLSLYITEKGLYFRLIIDESNNLAVSSYKKVKRGALRKASITFSYEKSKKKRQYEIENEVNLLSTIYQLGADNYIYLTTPYTLFEVCLCNQPQDLQTFVTTDPNDSRFSGIDWNNPITITNNPSIKTLENFKHRFDQKAWIQTEMEALWQELKELRNQNKALLGGSKR